MSDWKTMQFQDAAKAQAHHDALTRLGCEVIQENQGGRIDVRYRCMNWKRLAFANHGEAHEWETWLRNSGFQVRHAH